MHKWNSEVGGGTHGRRVWVTEEVMVVAWQRRRR